MPNDSTSLYIIQFALCDTGIWICFVNFNNTNAVVIQDHVLYRVHKIIFYDKPIYLQVTNWRVWLFFQAIQYFESNTESAKDKS